VRLEGSRDATDALAAHFGTRRVLLVLDNFEQVIAAGPELKTLLERAPNLAMLVTSRRPLRVQGEQEQQVGPLAMPPHGATVDEVRASAAVQLFVDRARDVRAGFALTAANAEAIADLCRRLDGLPLALELAAARVRLLTPEALLRRLGGHLDLRSAAPIWPNGSRRCARPSTGAMTSSTHVSARSSAGSACSRGVRRSMPRKASAPSPTSPTS
jgi:predicted ATPase